MFLTILNVGNEKVGKISVLGNFVWGQSAIPGRAREVSPVTLIPLGVLDQSHHRGTELLCGFPGQENARKGEKEENGC